MKYMMLHYFVAGELTPVLCESEDCPGPVHVVIQKLSSSDTKKWLKDYAARTNAVLSELQFVDI